MSVSPVQKLHQLGQSIWYDNIQRRLLMDGTLQGMIQQGEIWGVTSNPTIFNHAITQSNDYEDAITVMAWAGLSSPEIFWNLAVEDVQLAADLFLPVFQSTNGMDGYVSLEVDPRLANDARKTVTEALKLWRRVDRPNLMIKIPATRQGLKAIRVAIAAGINVNVTLIFRGSVMLK